MLKRFTPDLNSQAQTSLFVLFALRDSNAGMTIIELMVAMTIGLGMLGMVFVTTMSNQNSFRYDVARTQLNQNLRGVLDLVGNDLREAGERLPGSFPAIEIVNGTPGEPDELIVRRNLVDEVMVLCRPIAAGTATASLYVADDAAGLAGCDYSGETHNYGVWKDYRNVGGTEPSRTVKAYIFDFGTEVGEFFDYSGETDLGTALTISRTGGNWENDYVEGSSAIYLLEEMHYVLVDDVEGNKVVQVITNGDTENPQNVTYGITDFQAKALLEDGTTQTSFGVADDWSLLKAVEITFSGQAVEKGRVITSSLTGRYFPRNVLSN